MDKGLGYPRFHQPHMAKLYYLYNTKMTDYADDMVSEDKNDLLKIEKEFDGLHQGQNSLVFSPDSVTSAKRRIGPLGVSPVFVLYSSNFGPFMPKLGHN